MEQLDAESLFQFAALFGNGLLAQIQALHRTHEAAFKGDRLKGTELSDIDNSYSTNRKTI